MTRRMMAGVIVALVMALGLSIRADEPQPKPVEIQVLDEKSGEPVRRFAYHYRITSVDAAADRDTCEGIEAKTTDGVVRIPAPRFGRIWISVLADGYLSDFHHGHGSFEIKAEDKRRRFTLKLTPGSPLTGRVIDEQTGNPIEGARVAPIHFTPPLFTGNWALAVKTDEDGRFSLPCYDPSLRIEVHHPGYECQSEGGFGRPLPGRRSPAGSGGKGDVVIRLRPLITIRGQVVDEQRRPIPGVRISTSTGPDDETDAEGRFRIEVPPRFWMLTNRGESQTMLFRHDAYFENNIPAKEISRKGEKQLVVTLKRGHLLAGQVFDDEARPQREYTVRVVETGCVGSEKGKCEGPHAEGRWEMNIGEDGPLGVVVIASGFAPWHRECSLKDFERPLVTRLSRGHRVSGRLSADDCRPSEMGGPHVMLVPSELVEVGQSDDRKDFLYRVARPDRDGAFHIDQVGPGRYLMQTLRSDGAVRRQDIAVRDSDVDLEEIDLPDAGRIVGVAFEPDDATKIRSNSPGIIRGESYLLRKFQDVDEGVDWSFYYERQFTTDDRGRFVINNVPAGDLAVGFLYRATADIIDAHDRMVRVVPGGTTNIALFAHDQHRRVPIDIVIGDGSETHALAAAGLDRSSQEPPPTAPGTSVFEEPTGFEFPYLVAEILPAEERPVYWAADQQGVSLTHDEVSSPNGHDVVMPDVSPGRWQLKVGVGNRRDFTDVLVQREIGVAEGMKPIRVELPGASMTGAIVCWESQYSKLFAIPQAPNLPTRVRTVGFLRYRREPSAAASETPPVARTKPLDFRFECLAPGTYLLRAIGREGFAKKDNVVVRQGAVARLRNLERETGATVRGVVRLPSQADVLSAVNLVAPEGVRVAASTQQQPNKVTFEQEHLWPGDWRVEVLDSEEEVVASKPIHVAGTEDIFVEMEVKR